MSPDPVMAFEQAMADAGIVATERIVPDGRLRRFRVDGDKRGTRNGWYVLYGDGVPAGRFGCWKRGFDARWSAKTLGEMTGPERAAHSRRMESARRAREQEEARRREEARQEAESLWASAAEAPVDHPYLLAKQVKPWGLRVDREGSLLVPVRDVLGGIHSLQRIHGDGEKRFLPGGAVTGHFHTIGETGALVYIAEGFATAASIHEATRGAVAVAFNAGNLAPVAQAIRAAHPQAQIVVCADNDQWTEGNPGLKRARDAARAVGARLAVPEFRDTSGKPTDFNDLAKLEGLDAVRHQLEAATPVEDPPERPAEPLFTPQEASVAELLTTEPPPRRWIVRNLILAVKAGLLVGPGGTGKSFLSLQIAVAIATGLPVCGHWEVAEAGQVVVIAAEDDRDELHRRLHVVVESALQDVPLDVGDLAARRAWLTERLARNLLVVSRVGQETLLTHADGKEVTQTDTLVRLIAAVRQFPAPRLVILDPVARVRGGEENAAEDTTRFVEALERLAQETGCAVLALHHANKDAQRSGALGAQHAARGSSALVDGVRFAFNLAVMSEDEATERGYSDADRLHYVRFTVAKSNYGAPSAPDWLYRENGGALRHLPLGVLAPTKKERTASEYEAVLVRIKDHLRKLGARGEEVSKRKLETEWAGKEGILGVGKHALRGILSRAIEEGSLVLRPPRVKQKNVDAVLALPDEGEGDEATSSPEAQSVEAAETEEERTCS